MFTNFLAGAFMYLGGGFGLMAFQISMRPEWGSLGSLVENPFGAIVMSVALATTSTIIRRN